MKQSSTLPKTLEARVAAVARRLGKPPAVVLREAIDEYTARHDQEAMMAAVNRVAEAIDTRLEPDLAAAANRVLARTEW